MISAANAVIKFIKAGSLIGFSLFLLLTCGKSSPELIRVSGNTMGTSYHISLVGVPDTLSQQAIELGIDQVLADVDSKMSTYKPNSELSRFNQAALHEVVQVSQDTIAVVRQSLALADLSGGSFNPAIGPLVNLWGFGPDPQQDIRPSDKQIKAALGAINYKAVAVQADGILKSRVVSLDLSAIAKGFGVDKVAEYLLAQGVQNFLVEVGGEIRVAGNSPRGGQWRLAIEAPGADYGVAYDSLSLTNAAVATSGDYRNYYEHNGERYSHTINPITGYPIDHNLASVTVVADRAALADGLATAINVMGPEQGLAFSELHSLAVFMIVKTETGYNEIYSSGFEQYLERE